MLEIYQYLIFLMLGYEFRCIFIIIFISYFSLFFSNANLLIK